MSVGIKAGRRRIEITRPDKELFPGITKQHLAEYYAAVAPAMLSHVRDRALTMERFPDGIAGERLFQKNIPRYFPEWVARAQLRKQKGTVTHVVANDASTLVYLANQATITPHVALSRVDRPDQPDQLIFDLDPSGPDFEPVRETALELRSILEELGMRAFVKTTGSKGLHVMTPIRRGPRFEQAGAFAASIADELIRRHPSVLTSEFLKADREGRIFLDIGRNAYAQTAVAPYGVRARPGAPVATPLDWAELEDRALRANTFTIREVPARLERSGDPWRTWRAHARALPEVPVFA